jgi:hypothetical protein
MDDKQIINNLFNEQSVACDSYNRVIPLCHNVKIRDEMLKIFSIEHNMQEVIFNEGIKRGYYKFIPEDSKVIEEFKKSNEN